MIVDCHTHIDFSVNDVDVSEHLAAAETVDVCFVLGRGGGPSEEVNENLAEYVEKHKAKMVGFAVVDPPNDKVGLANVRPIQEKLGLEGAVLYCSASGFHPTHSRAMRFYESAAELGMPVFFHNWEAVSSREAILEYAQPYLLDEVARSFPELKMIVGGMGVPFMEQTFALVAKHANVYADLTVRPSSVWQVYNTVVAANERGVMAKLLFGSGFPLGRAQQCIETLLGFNKLLADTNLPTVPRDKIRTIVEGETLKVLGIGGKIAEAAAAQRIQDVEQIAADEIGEPELADS
ncbi:MAG: amidohydrolase family protein [Sedimentisphaerales bacterium]|nr:amidohydrolase family protein [Sedimentisphaerales bacterium]